MTLLCWLLVRGRERALVTARALSDELARRQNVQKALEESEERWKFALEGAGDGVWDWHVADNKVYASSRWKEMLGYGQDELGDSLQEWEAHIHPEDLAQCYDGIRRHLEGETPIYVSEHRMRCKHGGYRWFLDRGMIIGRDENGKPLRVIGTHSDITERKAAERKLAENEARLRAVLETAVDAVIVIDAYGRIALFNPAAERIFGYHADEVLGCNVNLLMPEPYRSAHDGYLRRFMETGDARIIGIGREVVGRRKDGSQFPLDLAVGEMTVNGQRQFTGILRDISERKQAEALLKESESKLRLVMDNIAEVFWMADVDSEKTFYVSPGYERVWRHSCQELYDNPHSFFDAVHPDDRERVQANLATEKTGQPFECEFRIVWPDGTVRWIRDRGFPVPADSGPVKQYVGLAEDITELKRREQLEDELRIADAVAAERGQAEEKLRQQKERYQLLLNSIGKGIFGLDVQGRCTFCNPAGLTLLGYRHEADLVGKDIHCLIHHTLADGTPCDKERCEVRQALLTDEIIHGADDVFWRADGSSFFAEYWSYPQYENGEAIGAVVTFSDVTLHKEAEQSRLLAAKVFESSSEAILVTDSRNVIVSVNPAFTDITGYSAAEAIGQTPRILKSGRHDEAFYREMWSTLLKNGHWEGEIWDRRKNGEIYPSGPTSTPSRSPAGSPTSWRFFPTLPSARPARSISSGWPITTC
ncbi:PAS domain-containing protein [Methylogaea oryzae]|uniref:PAS domain-containing protein n=1 Tax=Methylogaea oryzae TaxID=1295382 RepID=UPI0006D1CD6B|nr:PAS domain S-box protein [Methylogaea oryzae]